MARFGNVTLVASSLEDVSWEGGFSSVVRTRNGKLGGLKHIVSAFLMRLMEIM